MTATLALIAVIALLFAAIALFVWLTVKELGKPSEPFNLDARLRINKPGKSRR